MAEAVEIAEIHRRGHLRAGVRVQFLVYAKHCRVVGRIQVQADDIPHVPDEERIGGQLERLRLVPPDDKRVLPTIAGLMGSPRSSRGCACFRS